MVCCYISKIPYKFLNIINRKKPGHFDTKVTLIQIHKNIWSEKKIFFNDLPVTLTNNVRKCLAVILILQFFYNQLKALRLILTEQNRRINMRWTFNFECPFWTTICRIDLPASDHLRERVDDHGFQQPFLVKSLNSSSCIKLYFTSRDCKSCRNICIKLQGQHAYLPISQYSSVKIGLI